MVASESAATPGGSLRALDLVHVNRFHRRVTFLSGMGVFLEGYDFTNIASALIFLVPYFKLSAGTTAALTTSTYVGTIIGALAAGWIADRYGRKAMYMVDMAVYGLFAVISAFSVSVAMLMAARVGLGLAIGADQALSFTIIAEFAPQRRRGRLNAYTWVMWTAASLLTYVISYVLNPVLGENTWRVLFLASVIPVVIVLVMRARLPETPRWLLQHGRYAEARAAIAQTLGQARVEGTMESLAAATRRGSGRAAGYLDLFRGAQLPRTLYISFMWFCITVNTYGIGYFAPYIFRQLGFTKGQSLFGGMMVAGFALIGSIIMTLSVERVGRKALSVAGFGIRALVNIALSVTSENPVFIVLLLLFGLFQLAAWIGPAGLVGVVAPEVFPTEMRSLGTGFAAALGRAGSIVGVVVMPLLLHSVHLRGAMLFYFAVAAVAFAAMLVFGKETKGVALEDLFGEPEATRSPLTSRTEGSA